LGLENFLRNSSLTGRLGGTMITVGWDKERGWLPGMPQPPYFQLVTKKGGGGGGGA